jgi:hypothetical protein
MKAGDIVVVTVADPSIPAVVAPWTATLLEAEISHPSLLVYRVTPPSDIPEVYWWVRAVRPATPEEAAAYRLAVAEVL